MINFIRELRKLLIAFNFNPLSLFPPLQFRLPWSKFLLTWSCQGPRDGYNLDELHNEGLLGLHLGRTMPFSPLSGNILATISFYISIVFWLEMSIPNCRFAMSIAQGSTRRWMALMSSLSSLSSIIELYGEGGDWGRLAFKCKWPNLLLCMRHAISQ